MRGRMTRRDATDRAARVQNASPIEALESRIALSAVAWTGEGGNSLWSNPANWSGGAVPGNSSEVVIASALGSYAVVIDSGPVRVASLTLGERLIINRGVTLNVNGDFDLVSGADLRINGLVNWMAGEWEDGATAAVNAGGALNIGSTSSPTIGSVTIANDIANNGILRWRGGTIEIVAGGSMTNAAGKAMDIASPLAITGDGVVTNYGLLRRGGGANTTTTISTDFNNADRVRVLRGTLAFESGGGSPALINNYGGFSTNVSEAVIRMAQPAYHRDASFTGSGQFSFTNFTQIFRGAVYFASGTFESSAPVYIDAGGATFSGNAAILSSLYLEGDLTVGGTLTVQSALVEGPFNVTLFGTLSLNNADIDSDVVVASSGTLFSTGSSRIDADVTNQGSISVLSGTLTIDATGLGQSGVVTNQGSIILGSTSTLAIVGNLSSTGIIDSTVSASRAGRIQVSGDLALGGTLRARFTGGGFTSGPSFTVLTATGVRSGMFSTFTPINPPASLSASMQYTVSGARVGLS